MERTRLAVNVEKYRNAKGYTQPELARLVDVDQTMISKIEKGKRNPSVPLLEDLADKLGVTIDDLVRG